MIVLATSNKHKVQEFRKILSDFPLEIKSLSDFGPIPEAIEDGIDFDENAYKKSSHVSRILGIPAIADDSGLVVPALNGEPGVYSARYAGEKASDDENIDRLLYRMKNITDRKAYFQCVISIAVPNGPALTYEGRCDGIILDKKVGFNGFGYDPVFFIPELNKSFAELNMVEKNSISHRGKALAEVCSEQNKIQRWLEIRSAEY